MADPRNPLWLAVLTLVKYPASAGTTTLRVSMRRTVAFNEQLYYPRIKSVGEIKRAASDPDGNLVVSSASLTLEDEDGALADMLEAGQPTEYWLSREIAIYCISEEGKNAGLTIADVEPVFRGWITDVQTPPYEVFVSASGVLGSMMSAANVDQKALRYRFKDLVATPIEKNADLPLPVLLGEFSDLNAVDKFGNYAERGIVPVFELAEINTDDVTEPPGDGLPEPPVITSGTVVGTSGQELLYYGATLITPFGESRMSNIVAIDGASARDLSNYNAVVGTFVLGDPANQNVVRIWRGTSADAMSGWLDAAYDDGVSTFGYFDGAAPWPTPSRDELDILKHMDPPTQDTTSNWSFMVVCQGIGDYVIPKAWGSNLADGVQSKREEVPAGDRGVTTILPSDAQWPFANSWVEFNGIRVFGFLQRGPRLAAHRDGSVTMAVSLAGPIIGGLLLDRAFRQVQFLINEYMIKNGGTGNRNEDPGVLEEYANGDHIIETDSFEDCQTLSAEWLSDAEGYKGNIHIHDPELTWRDVLRNFCQTFGARITENRFGQIRGFLIDTAPAEAGEGRHFRSRIEILDVGTPTLAHDQVVNRILLSYYYDIDADAFRGKGIPLQYDASIAAHIPGGVIGTPDRRGVREIELECIYTNYPTTAMDVGNRELVRRQRRPRYPVIITPLLSLDHDIGDPGRITSTPTRDVETPGVIIGHTIYPDVDQIELLFQDREGIILEAFSELGDEVTGPTAPQIGDETSVPPTAPQIG